MKNIKQPYILAAAVIILTIFMIVINFGGKKKIKLSNPELYTAYISAYTGDIISKNDVISIQLTDEFANSIKDKKTSIISLSPKVKGSISWKENNIIEFKPDKALESGKSYVVKLNLGKLDKSLEKELEEFVFRVQTKHQILGVGFENIVSTDRQDFKTQDVSGKIRLNDIEKIEDLKQCLSAEIGGSNLDISIEQANELEYLFTIKDIKRTNKEQTLILRYNGEKINSKSDSRIELVIPPLDVFTIVDIKLHQYPEQYINIMFSDPIKEDQLLDGLINLSDLNNLKYIIIDNNIKIFPSERLDKSYTLSIATGVKNIHDKKLDTQTTKQISFRMRNPELLLRDKGVIIPTCEHGQIVSFDAVNIKAVDVRIYKIYENNVLQFLQENTLSGSYNLNKVGKVIRTKTISLEQADVNVWEDWNTFHINLSDIIESEPGAIYRIEIGYRKENCIYPCNDEKVENIAVKADNLHYLNDDNNWNWFTNYTYSSGYNDYAYDEYYDENYYYDDYYYDNYAYDYNDDYYDYSLSSYDSYNDPCHDNYYGYRRSIKFNVLASDIGLIGKLGKDNIVHAFVTNLLTTDAITGAEVLVYNYQQQVIGKGKTNGEGKALIEIDKNDEAYFIVASNGKHKSYLKLEEYGSLSTSEFNVYGEYIQDGTKAFIYTERGVWRPGDSIYMGLILNEMLEPLPIGHPIVLEVRNPRNQEVYREVQQKNEKGFHVFKFKTEPNDPTGYYNAKFIIGGKVFTKSLMVETIRPNRLNIELSLDKDYLAGDGSVTALIKAKWLHGADAADLETNVTMSLTEKYTPFENHKDYNFYNSMTNFTFTTTNLFTGKTNQKGEIETLVKFDKINNAPGVLNADLTVKVFEKGGNFSIGEKSVVYYPYTRFIGAKIAENEEYQNSFPLNKNLTLDIIAIDRDQKFSSEDTELEVSIYKMAYSWWYDYQYDGKDYISANYNNALSRVILKTKNGKAKTDILFEDNGSHLIVVKDKRGGHTTAFTVYASSYASSDVAAVDQLVFKSDKENYNVGENVSIEIPSGSGKALVSIENSSSVLKTFWVKAEKGSINIDFEASPEMAPNVYVNVTFIQTHNNSSNSRPIRMYGIIPVLVEDPQTHLSPIINMPDELLAESKVRIQVREENGKAMTYTLAMVDEGLLNLTNFKTPNPWEHFFRKEALGVRTWDIYKFVVGAFSIDAGKMLSIGGGEGDLSPEDLLQAIRFKPMVRFIGPFTLKPGSSNTHEIQLPQYIGSVRTMVIAADNNAYGSAFKTTAVKKPLMILGSGPRVLGTNENFSLPVTVFAMKSDVKNVNISVKTNDLISIDGAPTKTVSFNKEGEKFVNFNLKSGSKTGVAKIEITATSGNHVSKYNFELNVRHANILQTDIIDDVVSDKEYNVNFNAFGIEGSNETYLELYSIPPMNLESRLSYLTSYPHGCLEQIISAAFPQLYLDALVDLSNDQKADVQKNINAGIIQIQRYQMANGGLAYWPGGNNVSEWATNYAGHFIIEAEKAGYSIPGNLRANWLKYQKEKASKWVDDGTASQLTQAYRLYTLAIAGQADRSAMNRLKESKISAQATWRLAAAYAVSGKESIAKQMISKLGTEIPKYFELSGTFGSDIRDKAMILETLTELGEKEKAFMVLKEISDVMGSSRYASTQTTAYSLLAASKFVKKYGASDNIDCTYKINGKEFTAKTTKPVYKVKLNVPDNEKNEFTLKSNNKTMVFVRIIRKGIPEVGNETAASSNINMTINYTYLTGQPIDVTSIPQGTDFVASVTLTNSSGYKNLDNVALSQIFPSGWEIINSRMFTVELGNDSYYTYQDIRDDRVLTYLDMYKPAVYTYRVLLNAAFVGKYYLPSTICETMYDDSNFARTKGTWVNVVSN